MKYLDPDGREDNYYFDYEEFLYDQFYAESLMFECSWENFSGEFKNFFYNIFHGNAKFGSYYSVSLDIGTSSFDAVMYIYGTDIEFALPFDNLNEISIFNKLIDSPIKIDINGIEGAIPLGIYYGIDLSVPIKCEYDGRNYTVLSIGLQSSVGNLNSDSLGFSLSTGYAVKASVNDGPNATLQNRKSREMNSKYKTWEYLKDPKNWYYYFKEY